MFQKGILDDPKDFEYYKFKVYLECSKNAAHY